jgi:hypothetical protein
MRTTKTEWEVTVERRGAEDNYSGFRRASPSAAAQKSGSRADRVAREHLARCGAASTQGAPRCTGNERMFRTSRTASRG